VRILSRLREKDPEGATKLTAEMLEKFRTEDLGSNEQARNVALNLLLEVSRSDRDLQSNQAHSSDRFSTLRKRNIPAKIGVGYSTKPEL